MLNILKIDNLTENIIKKLVDYDKEFTNPEYQHLFTLISLNFINCEHTLKFIEKLIKSGFLPIYSFEIKNHLFFNCKELYEEYSKLFLNNAGCYEAFGIEANCRKPFKKIFKPTEIQTLEPFYRDYKKKKERDVKKNIRRVARKEAGERSEKLREETREYKDKVKDMMKKIQRDF
ncbi:hypothetical protein GVAV_001445 [Gurleya vavrai]